MVETPALRKRRSSRSAFFLKSAAHFWMLPNDERSRARISMLAPGSDALMDETSVSALAMETGRAQR